MQTEMENLIYRNLDEAVEKFLADLPPGVIEEAFRAHVTGPARLAARVDAKIRDLVPPPTVLIPVLEGVVVPEPVTRQEKEGENT